MDSLSPSAVLQHLLSEHTIVRAHFNVNHPQLQLPAEVVKAHRDTGIVMLEMGYDMPVPIYGWAFLEQALECTCSFGRVPYNCVLPWEALIMVAPNDDSVQCVWPAALRQVAHGTPMTNRLPTDNKPSHLSVVK